MGQHEKQCPLCPDKSDVINEHMAKVHDITDANMVRWMVKVNEAASPSSHIFYRISIYVWKRTIVRLNLKIVLASFILRRLWLSGGKLNLKDSTYHTIFV